MYQFISGSEFPSSEDFFKFFRSESNKFIDDEGYYWDFKDEFPFSFSNDYFYGLCRLICAFYNTYGGLIIFGVDDETKLPVKTKVRPNTDRFYSKAFEIFGRNIDLKTNTYSDANGHDYVCVKVPFRKKNQPLLKFSQKYGKYEADIIWVREGSIVKQASSKHFRSLFGAENIFLESESGQLFDASIESFLPSRTATLNEFIGRVGTLNKLFDWVWTERTFVKYLSGQGGSGKTTIAFEFAKLISDYGKNVLNRNGKSFDFVIFLSAKEFEFAGLQEGIIKTSDLAFDDYRSFLIAALEPVTPDFSSIVDTLSEEGLEDKLTEFLSEFAVLFILDDIDTLNNKSKDFSYSGLFQILAQTNKGSKVLYTLRQNPSVGMRDTIEVAGLEQGSEFPAFVKACCNQFAVPMPNAREESTIYEEYEGKPLAIEALIKFRRTCDSYERAISLSKTKKGDALLDYIYKREWDKISSSSRGRQFLVALHELKRPSTIEDIKAVLQLDIELVFDALHATKEIFVSVEFENGKEKYYLPKLTRNFIGLVKKDVAGYPRIKQLSTIFLSNIKGKSQRILDLERIIRRTLELQGAKQALDALGDVRNKDLMDDPHYRAIRVWICSQIESSSVEDIKIDVSFVINMGVKPDFVSIYSWAKLLKYKSKLEYLKDVVSYVEGSEYTKPEKAIVINIYCSLVLNIAREYRYTDLDRFFEYEFEVISLKCKSYFLNLSAQNDHYIIDGDDANKAARIVSTNSAVCQSAKVVTSFLNSVLESKVGIYLDPIMDQILAISRSILNTNYEKLEDGKKTKNLFKVALRAVENKEFWYDAVKKSQFSNGLAEVLKNN